MVILTGIIELFIIFTLLVLSYKFFGRTGLIFWVGFGIIIANLQVLKAVDVLGFEATLGNIMFASLYLATDILNEKYGRNVAKKAVWMGLFSMIAFTLISQITLVFTPSKSDFAHEHLEVILGLVPRIAIASAISYVIGNFFDVWVFNKIRTLVRADRKFYIRAIGSTSLSSIIDTALFALIAFYGTYPNEVVLNIFITTYILKLLTTVFNVPFGYIAKSIKPLSERQYK
ncbi:queuosine precursor transporter [Abyssicoccus albus]|uniref:Probable queuosine precursor transporter n=1 Tax=Abyssicoccus albus TaxID=1817405 RepID=A0A1Q1G1H7_9BACL|nr:queuosine precursor transporter [Abyssicoccus albus]AQL56190.1 hypothetical protein BVH56_04300 [Abyssicoccus albus]RPF57994.1 hypothetical protein EDD62_0631 [Abyssicoccus albus]